MSVLVLAVLAVAACNVISALALAGLRRYLDRHDIGD